MKKVMNYQYFSSGSCSFCGCCPPYLGLDHIDPQSSFLFVAKISKSSLQSLGLAAHLWLTCDCVMAKTQILLHSPVGNRWKFKISTLTHQFTPFQMPLSHFLPTQNGQAYNRQSQVLSKLSKCTNCCPNTKFLKHSTDFSKSSSSCRHKNSEGANSLLVKCQYNVWINGG